MDFPASPPSLVGIEGSTSTSGAKLDLTSKHREYVVGASAASDLVVDDSLGFSTGAMFRISRRHVVVRFARANQTWEIFKVGGRGGAKLVVNGRFVDGNHVLRDGDEIRLDGTRFRATYRDEDRKIKSSESDRDKLSDKVDVLDRTQQEFSSKLKVMERSMKETQTELKDAQETLAAVLKDMDRHKSCSDEEMKLLRAENENLRNQLKRHVSPAGSSSESPEVKRPKSGVGSGDDATSRFSEELKCSVCGELFVDATSVGCGHVFCAYCIDKWRATNREFTCPNCRQPVNSFHRIPAVDNLVGVAVSLMDEEGRGERESLVRERAVQVEEAERRQQETGPQEAEEEEGDIDEHDRTSIISSSPDSYSTASSSPERRSDDDRQSVVSVDSVRRESDAGDDWEEQDLYTTWNAEDWVSSEDGWGSSRSWSIREEEEEEEQSSFGNDESHDSDDDDHDNDSSSSSIQSPSDSSSSEF